MNTRLPLGLSAYFFAVFTANGAPIVISGWLSVLDGNDSPYEYAQFVATQDINFAATPYTIVWNDVGTDPSLIPQGWAASSVISYAFQLTTGTVTRGEVFYIGGSAQVIAGAGSTSIAGQRWLRAINTSTTGGDGLGVADASGVFGNGGPNADGIAVFAGLASGITTTTVPLDSIFFGAAIGTAHPTSGGFKLADNDHYSSAGVFGDPGNSFLYGDLAQNQFQRLSGKYNWATNEWEMARTGEAVTLNIGSQAAAIASQIEIVPEPGVSLTGICGLGILALRRWRKV